KTEIKMAVHPLQRGNDHTLFRRRDPKNMAIQFSCDTSLDHSPSHEFMFSGLSQILNVDFHQLGKSGNRKIPFVGQTIAPAARLLLGLEFSRHDASDGVFVSGRVE